MKHDHIKSLTMSEHITTMRRVRIMNNGRSIARIVVSSRGILMGHIRMISEIFPRINSCYNILNGRDRPSNEVIGETLKYGSPLAPALQRLAAEFKQYSCRSGSGVMSGGYIRIGFRIAR